MNNIKTHISFRFLTVLLAVLMGFTVSSCHDDFMLAEGQYWAGDGRKVTVSLGVQAFDMGEKTRAVLTQEEENSVKDLYVLMFKLNSADDTNPTVQNAKRYFQADELGTAVAESNHSTAGTVQVPDVLTGTYYIAAVANVLHGQMNGQDLKASLDAVTNLNEFKALNVELASKGNLTRSALTMSGYFMPLNQTGYVHNAPGTAVVSGSGVTDGYIHLRRLDAQVHFNIRQDIEGVKLFRVTSWQVVNIPNSASVIEAPRSGNTFTDRCTSYSSTIANTSGWTSTTGVGSVMDEYQLDFYMLENRGVTKGSTGIDSYRKREEEIKNADGTNKATPDYKFAPNNSAYLVLEAEIQQEVTEGGETFERFANSRYVIHLGYCDNETVGGVTSKANDFKNERNTRYIYNVTIKGANEIVIEAENEHLESWNHGTEGTVIDVRGGQVIDLDAHYGVFNIVLTPKELAESQFMMMTPNGRWSTIGKTYGQPGYPDPWTEDFQHIRIAYNAEGTTQLRNSQPVTKLVSYSTTYDHDCPTGTVISSIPQSSHTMIPIHHEKKQIQDGNHTVPLYDMHCFKQDYGTSYATSGAVGTAGINEDTPLVFTVFINEFYYYYENGIINKNEVYGNDGYVASNETPRDYTMWKKFVNLPEGRSFILFTDMRDSSDKDSHHLVARYHIRQRSIETFYGDHILDGFNKNSANLPAAMGLEQINEHHYKNLAATTRYTYGNTSEKGWDITKRNLTAGGKNTWAYHVDQTTILGSTADNDNGVNAYPTFRSKTAQELGYVANATNWDYKTIAYDRYNHEVIDVAATRNRDLNRDGNITQDEVRWFAPTSREYVTFAVGAGALPTPLFDKSKFDSSKTYWSAWPINFNWKKVYYNGIFHFLGSDWWYLVSEESTATGKSNSMADDKNHDALNTQLSGAVRCARYLGVTTGDDGYAGINLPAPASYNPVNHVINTTNYSKQMHRNPVQGGLPPHDNLNVGNNGYNSLSDYFQVSTQNASAGIRIQAANGRNAEENLMYMMQHNDFCRDYNDPVLGGQGTWRTPNQVELALMYNYMPESELSFGNDATSVSQPNLLSCTYWYRNDEITSNFEGELNGSLVRHWQGARADGEGRKLAMIHAKNLYNNKYYTVRCVRDTDKNGNYAGSPEYNSPVNFQAGAFTADYTGDNVNIQVNASISAGTWQSVTIDGHTATVSGSTASVSNMPVTKSTVTVVWKVSYNGKTLTYRHDYQLPPRYWMISFHSIDNRYATVNQENNRTYVGAVDTRDKDKIDAIYKWIITTDPSGSNPVNVANLQENTTYYLYNAGTRQYISGPTGGTQTYMTVGGTPMTMKLIKHSDGIYTLRFNNATHANKNGGDGNFGTWTGTGDGNHYKLTPVVMRGSMPFYNVLGAKAMASGSNYQFTLSVSPEAIVNSVTINGNPVTVTGSAGSYVAFIPKASITGFVADVNWNVTFMGENRQLQKQYSLVPDFYAFRDNDNKNKVVTVNGSNQTVLRLDLPVEQNAGLPADAQWLLLLKNGDDFTNQKPTFPTTGIYLSTEYVLYNVGTGKYIGTSTSGTNNANNMTMVTDRSQAVTVIMGGNNWGKLLKFMVGGNTGYADRKQDLTIGVNPSLRHSWYFQLVTP